jgi:hypothetical protein
MSVKRVVSIVLIAGVVTLAMVAGPTRAMSPGQRADSLGLSHDATALASQVPDAAHAAGGPLGRNFNISNLTSTAAVVPSVAYNSDRDEYLVVWWNDRPGNDDIYGRRVSGDGALIGNWFAVAAGAGHERAFPDVAYNSQAEEYLVVWVDDYSDICAQRVSATGQLQGTEIDVGGMGGENWGPAVAYASTENKYLVVWTEKTGTVYAFVGKEVTSTGSPGTRFAIDPNCLNCNEAQADLAYNRPRNEFLVVWGEHIGSDYDVYGRRVKMTGGTGTLGPAFPIFYSVNDEWTPVVAALPGHSGQGQYLVVCQTYIGVGDKWIQGQFVASDGSLQGSLVDVSSSSGATGPAVAGSESTGQYLVVWRQEGYTSLPFISNGIMGRAISIDGNPVGEESGIGGSAPFNAAVASGSLGDFLVAFDAQPVMTADPRQVYGQLWGNRVYLPLVLRN